MKTDNSDKIKRLYVSDTDKKIAGVCGGIAEYFSIDPTLVRLAWIIITFGSGVLPGCAAYIIAIIIMPKHVIYVQEPHVPRA